MNLSLRSDLGVEQWSDSFGTLTHEIPSDSLKTPALRLIRHDDAWRPLADRPASLSGEAGTWTAEWEDVFGGQTPFCRPKEVVFQHYWPAHFDAWPYAGDFHAHEAMPFSGTVRTSPVSTSQAEGTRFTIRLQDQRDPSKTYPQEVIKLPVGIEMPLSSSARVYGGQDLYTEHRQIHTRLDDPELPRKWYYLEGELFGMRSPAPLLDETLDPGRPKDEIHCSAPFAACSEDGHLWWGLASEPDYGAAVFFGQDRVRLFTTLYLEPGGSAEWSFVLWRQETDRPEELLLEASRTDGFFNHLNPLGFTPKGAPEGPIIFDNYPRILHEWEQIKALRPGLVIFNYHYDHISSTANLYGEWETYEGFTLKEEDFKKTIADLKALGTKVGFYGSTVEQPESHKVIDPTDIVLDRWSRRWHAWEPGNWVIDAGNRGAADRIAKAEAEFAQYYGLDAVFVDRLDHLGVNYNPERVGEGDPEGRLRLIPSVRLGLIELNRARIRWQRKLNPDLYIGLNNTTFWAGVRYSDFNLIEGGDEIGDLALPWLHQPNGVVNKRHFAILFADQNKTTSLFQTIGGHENASGFLNTLRMFMRSSLVSGVIPQPYGDEIFVDPKSMFYAPDRDKTKPDEEKHAILASYEYAGGDVWRQWWDEIQPALQAAEKLATPVRSVTSTPDSGPLPFKHRFLARKGVAGGLYIGLINESEEDQSLDLKVFGQTIQAHVPKGHTLAAWKAEDEELDVLVW